LPRAFSAGFRLPVQSRVLPSRYLLKRGRDGRMLIAPRQIGVDAELQALGLVAAGADERGDVLELREVRHFVHGKRFPRAFLSVPKLVAHKGDALAHLPRPVRSRFPPKQRFHACACTVALGHVEKLPREGEAFRHRGAAVFVEPDVGLELKAPRCRQRQGGQQGAPRASHRVAVASGAVWGHHFGPPVTLAASAARAKRASSRSCAP